MGDFHYLYGSDNSGNIINVKNIKAMVKVIGGNKCDIITADGGIDYTDYYCNLEKKFFELFIA